jgi:hypothetical protein
MMESTSVYLEKRLYLLQLSQIVFSVLCLAAEGLVTFPCFIAFVWLLAHLGGADIPDISVGIVFSSQFTLSMLVPYLFLHCLYIAVFSERKFIINVFAAERIRRSTGAFGVCQKRLLLR